jgi:2-oxoisovalerate dehydrogenase E2 component (dihydrolipoyl transacylase)
MTVTRKEFRLPDLGEGLTESDIVAWRVAAGDAVQLNQIIAEVETAKALVELPSPYTGVIAELHAQAGDTVTVGEPLVTFELQSDAPAGDAAPDDASPEEDDAPPPNLVGYGAAAERKGKPGRRPRRSSTLTTPPPAPVAVKPTRPERHPSTPPVRVLARRLGVDLETITGTGPGGLVLRSDVEKASHPAATSPAAPRTTGDTRIPIRGVRKHTAAAMVASAFTAPHVTEFLTVDVTPTIDLLDHMRENPLAAGTRVTLLALVAHAVCDELVRHPALNSSWDEAAQEIVLHGAVNLGIAAATERGLVVPNIPDAGALSLLGLARELNDLTSLAREGRTPVERMRNGTFTITNVGVFGIDAGTPIINPGEAAILALGAAVRRPWEYRGEIALRHTMTLSLSFDHRLVDGEQGSRFLAAVGARLAEPGLALLSEPVASANAGTTR